MPITITGVTSSLNELDRDTQSFIANELRTRALRALGDVKLATPVDTGRARNSWHIGYTPSFNTTGAGVTILTRSDEIQEIIVTNGTDYIQFLNDGSSRQAPTKFIEQAFLRYFDNVRVEVIN
ncbi:MAG: HK97 gp10 family phage protein [Bdellovibrionales bacterium]